MSKNPYYQNGEGYTDNTAGAAITGVVREEKRTETLWMNYDIGNEQMSLFI